MSSNTGPLGRALRIFLVNGTPDSVVVASLGGSTTIVLFAPRSALADLLARPESRRTGVYLLVGLDEENPTRSLVYVGEGDEVAARLAAHDKDSTKDFFERVCLIVSRDDEFHKAHSRYLESRLLTAIKRAGRASLVNGNEPPPKKLNEADLADMERVLTEVELILPTLGFDVLTPGPALKTTTQEAATVWRYRGGDCNARAKEAGSSFVVLADSIARSQEVASASDTTRAVRAQLVEDGAVEPTANGMWRFTRDVSFKSPSAAASAVYGGNVSGPQYWVHEDTGQSYGDWRAEKLSAAVRSEFDDVLG